MCEALEGARSEHHHHADERLLVRDLMTREVFTLGEDDDLTALYDLMDAQHIRHLPVVDEEGDLVGLVTHRDLLRAAMEQDPDVPMSVQRELLKTRSVGEIMTRAIETTEPDVDIREAAQTMFENKFGCLPVVEGSHLVGILTESDFVKHLAAAEA